MSQFNPKTASPPNKRRILVDARFRVQMRGGDRCRYELARNLLRRADADYTFVTYPHAAALLASGAHRPIVTPWTPERHPMSDFFEQVRLPLLGRAMGADIYHGTFNVVPFLRAARATVLTVPDMAVFAYPHAYGKRFAAYMRLLLNVSISRADRIIAISDATKQEIIRLRPDAAGKIVTVLLGVGQEFVDAAGLSQGHVDAALTRLGVPRPYVLFVGNLEPKKNLPRLIQAHARMRHASHLPHTLVIVGKKLTEGPDSGIDSVDRESGALHFTGFLEEADLPTLYRGADLVAYPSLYEGFGMPVLEAMAAGVPVLTSTVSSLPEVAGGAALLVDPEDVDAMAAGLRRALTDQAWREEAVHAGRARAAALTWDANARQTSAVYDALWQQITTQGPARRRPAPPAG